MVKITDLKQIKFFVGQILFHLNKKIEINYLRRDAKVDIRFYFPLEPDMAMVLAEDIPYLLIIPYLEKINFKKAST